MRVRMDYVQRVRTPRKTWMNTCTRTGLCTGFRIVIGRWIQVVGAKTGNLVGDSCGNANARNESVLKMNMKNVKGVRNSARELLR